MNKNFQNSRIKKEQACESSPVKKGSREVQTRAYIDTIYKKFTRNLWENNGGEYDVHLGANKKLCQCLGEK